MLPAPLFEPVRKTKKILLVYDRNDLPHCMLDDFILQGCNAKWPFASVRLGDVYPTRWLRSICAALHPLVLVCQSLIEIRFVFEPCNTYQVGSQNMKRYEKIVHFIAHGLFFRTLKWTIDFAELYIEPS
jgi:hypothetical protein